MSLFSKIKLGKGQAKEKKEQDAQKAAEEPPKAKYVHVPRHAAADAMTGAPPCWSAEDRPRIRAANQQRISREASRLSLPSIPRVQSSLSYVSYPASEATPVLAMHRNYSYNSMPGTSARHSRTPSLAERRARARPAGTDEEDIVPPMPRRHHTRTASGPSSLYGRGASANASLTSVGSGLEMMRIKKQPPVTMSGAAGLSDAGTSAPAGSRPAMARRSTTDMRAVSKQAAQAPTTKHARRISPLNPAAIGAASVEPALPTGSSQISSSDSSEVSESSSVHSHEALDSTAPSSVSRTPELATTKKEYQPPTGTKIAEALSVSKPPADNTLAKPARPLSFWKNKKQSVKSSEIEVLPTKAKSDSAKPELVTAPKQAVTTGTIEMTTDGAKPPKTRDEPKGDAKKKRWQWLGKSTPAVSA